MVTLVELPLEGSIENSRLRKVNPKKVRCKLPMLIPSRLICRSIQPGILSSHRKTIARDIVGRAIINDPRHDGLEILGGLVQACPAVVKRLRFGKCVVGDIGAVVSHDGGSDVKDDAVVVEYAGSAGGGAVACSEGFCEAVAEGGGMGAHPVICWLLICLDDDCVTLA